ncbi:MAG: cytochrome c [Gemmatimonadales bacterium]|jgi:cytochrome c553|nr:cytochrome c [Gemmatimonadales bacterium]
MMNHVAPITLTILLALGTAAGNTRARATDEVAFAPADTSAAQPENAGSPRTELLGATEVPRDTPPTGPPKPSGKGFKVSKLEYEGWRQYSANCARCHGQDVLPNPVAANLLLSLGPGGPIRSEQQFVDVVTAGRPAKGMPPFKDLLTQDRIKAIYAYVKGRAEKRLPPGRPTRPA